MKKSLFIILGILIIFILLAIWAYLLFFAKSEDNIALFNNFFDGEEVEILPLPDILPEETLPVDLERPSIRQLTLRPVAGFNEVVDTDGNLEIYFVEMGTGHLYSINLQSGEEQRLSGTTVVQARDAHISRDGNTVAIVSYTNTKLKNMTIFILDRENNSLTEVISDVVQDFHLSNNLLYYTVATSDGLEAYAYKLDTLIREVVFSLPFNEATVQWGDTIKGPHYVYPKASYALQGFLYVVEAGKLNRLPLEGFGFSALVSKEGVLFTKITDHLPMSYYYDRKTKEIKNLNLAALPEKCLLVENTESIICPHSQTTTLSYQMPDLWYQGVFSFVDSLQHINSATLSNFTLVDILAESGREVDIVKLSYDADFDGFFFTNKNDSSLWMYETFN